MYIVKLKVWVRIMKLFLVGGNDSIGVPYSRDNKNHIGFFELIYEEFSKKYEVIPFSFFHMSTYNTNSFIYEYLNQNYSLKEVKERQSRMLKKCKYSGLYPFIELPKKFLGFYEINEIDETIRIQDYLIRNKSIFIYSAGANDFLKHNQSSLFQMLFPNNIKNNLKSMEKVIEQCLLDMRRNITYILSLNNTCEVYVIGLFYPTNLSYIRKRLKDSIDLFNKMVESLCSEFENVYFVDNSNLVKGDFNNIDFHPNKRGHQKIYQNFMKTYGNRVNMK